MIPALHWLALALLVVAIISAFGALKTRSLLVTCMHVMTIGVSVAGAVMLLRPGIGGVALAVFAAAWAPVLLLAAMLLSARTTKSIRTWPWLSVLAALIVVAVLWWPLAELVREPPAPLEHGLTGLSFLLAPLVLVAGVVCVGVLGYGERGALSRETRA